MKTNYLQHLKLQDPLDSNYSQNFSADKYIELNILGEKYFLRKDLFDETKFEKIEKEIISNPYFEYINQFNPLLENLEISNSLHLDKIDSTCKIIQNLKKDLIKNKMFFMDEKTTRIIKGVLHFKKLFNEKYSNDFSDDNKPQTSDDEIKKINHLISISEENKIEYRKINIDNSKTTREFNPWKEMIPFQNIEAEVKKLVLFINGKPKKLEQEKWTGLKTENSNSIIKMFDQAPYLKSTFSHFFFIKIHPFLTGNGRTGRIIDQISFNISKNSLTKEIFDWYSNTLSIFIKKTNHEFIKSLEFTFYTKDLTYFFGYFKTLKELILKSLLYILKTVEKAKSWKLALITFFVQLNDGKMTLSSLRNQFGFDVETEAAVYKMLAKLEKNGVLKSIKVSKERIYTLNIDPIFEK